jgi:hypothetical protein
MKNKILKLVALVAAPAALLALASCSSTPAADTGASVNTNNLNLNINTNTDSDGSRGRVVLNSATATATVQSINAADRTVQLLHSDGSTSTYKCGPDVRNFDQIKVGDHVTATVAESLAIALLKGGDFPVGTGTSTAMVRSPLGDKPGMKVVDTVGFVAKIVSINAASREVTLQMADGTNQTVKAGPDIDLVNVNPGDSVGVRVTRATAIVVTEAP